MAPNSNNNVVLESILKTEVRKGFGLKGVIHYFAVQYLQKMRSFKKGRLKCISSGKLLSLT